MRSSKFLSLFCFFLSIKFFYAQEEKLELKLSGRGLFDAAYYNEKETTPDLTNGVHIADVRMGIKASYKKWYFRGDVSFHDNNVSLKDFYMQYSFKKNNRILLGHHIVPFGFSSAYGSANKEFLDETLANVYQPGRSIGISHLYFNKPMWIQYGIFADNSALTQSTEKSGAQGYTLAIRGVYKPLYELGKTIQLGISGIHRQAESAGAGKHNHIKYSKGFMTAVDKTKGIEVNINDALNENKATIELASYYHNLQIRTQFYTSTIHRENNAKYHSNGFYLTLMAIVNAGDYTYNDVAASINNPSNKNLELVLGYGFLDLNDSTATGLHSSENGIMGGKMTHHNIGLNYYWNKYVTLRAEYDMLTASTATLPKQKINTLQFRMMYLF